MTEEAFVFVKEVLFALIKDEAIEMPELPMSPKIKQLFEAVRRIHSKFGVWV